MSASSLYLSHINNIQIGNDDENIINSDAYLKIRENINRRFTEANWKKTRELSEEINKKTGLNTMSAIYYTIAITKTEGLKGLACGLEVLFAAMTHPDKKITKKNTQNEAINWMFRMIKDDIKSFSLKADDLRELYRCERACTGIEENIGADTSPNLSIAQQTLSTLINALQSSNHNVVNTITPTKKQLLPIVITLLFVTFITILTIFFHQQINISLRDIANSYQPHSNSSLAEDLEFLKTHYGARRVDKVTPIFINNYLQRINYRISLGSSNDLMQADKMLAEVEHVYGTSPEMSQQRTTIDRKKEKFHSEIDRLTQRFVNSRTHLANLNLSINNIEAYNTENIQDIKEKSKYIKNYAVSLSPFIGRAEYIHQQIEQGNIERAATELDMLNKGISSLQLKVFVLEKKAKDLL